MFKSARHAKTLLVEFLGSEEKLNLVLENYVEFEGELLQLTLQGIVFSDLDWSDFIGKIHTVNRRLLNVLSAGRLYLDQTRHAVATLFGVASTELEQINGKMSEEYDGHLGYRTMEALRNFVQHRGLGVHRLTEESWVVGEAPEHRVMSTMTPSIDVEYLEEAGGFKASVLAELRELGPRIELRPLVRAYVAGIVRVHDEFRQMSSSQVETAESRFNQLLERYEKESEEETSGVAVVALNDSGSVIDEVQLFKDLVSRREWLKNKNFRARHIERHFATGEPKTED